jgi:hypothetical protein
MQAKIILTIFKGGEFNPSALLPLTLITAQLLVLAILLLNALRNNYNLNFAYSMVNTGLYAMVLVFLVTFCLLNAITPHDS